MKRKIIILATTLILLTGCSATYDLYLDKNNITERTYIYDSTKKLEGLEYYDMDKGNEISIDLYANEVAAFENNFKYEKEEIKTNNGNNFGYRYNTSYKYNEFNKLSAVATCYDKIEIKNDGNISVKTSNEFKCFDKYSLLEDVTIRIHYTGKVLNTNADKVENDIYIWKITKDNYKNSGIIFTAEKVKTKIFSTFQIVGLIILTILIVITYLLYKRKNSGKI